MYSPEEIQRTLAALKVTTREALHLLIDEDATAEQVKGIKGVEDVRAPIVVWLRHLSPGDWLVYVGLPELPAILPQDQPEV